MKDAKIKQAFEVALEHLWDGHGAAWPKRKHICDALNVAAAAGELTQDQSQQAQDVIHARMSPQPNVIDWLANQGFITHTSAYNEDETHVQEFRHRWCNELIKEFS